MPVALIRLLAMLLVLSCPATGMKKTKISLLREQRPAIGLDGKIPTTPTLDEYEIRRRLRGSGSPGAKTDSQERNIHAKPDRVNYQSSLVSLKEDHSKDTMSW